LRPADTEAAYYVVDVVQESVRSGGSALGRVELTFVELGAACLGVARHLVVSPVVSVAVHKILI
jgi:hypothetical protein